MATKESKKMSGVSLSDLISQESTTTVEIGSFEVEFTWLPYVITMEKVEALEAAEEEGLDSLAHQLETVVVGWNLVLEEGKPFPPTAENMKKTPIELLVRINSAMLSGKEVSGEGGGSFDDA